jgi:glycerol uptake facilitator protein
MNQYVAEFLGTFFLILLGNGVVANVVLNKTKGQNSGWIVITTGWALAVFVGVVIAGPHSGAHLNPAVSVALAVADKFAWAEVPAYALSQLIGAAAGSLMVWFFYYDHFKSTDDINLRAACFYTQPAILNKGLNFMNELVGTFVLIFTIFYFTGAELENPKTVVGLGSLGAIPVAFLVWAIGLSLGGTTGYAINPVRDLGPRIVFFFINKGKAGVCNWSYSWIPVIGPLFGAALAALLFILLS